MGRLKDHLIGLEEDFWAIANNTVVHCERVEDFVSEMSEFSHYLPLISEDDEFTELLIDAWENYQSDKGHE